VEDAETGLYYNRFRYYDPKLGGYVSQDPIGLLGGLSAFAYVHDVLSWIDALGLAQMDPWSINFSQRTVGPQVDEYTRLMREGNWDWVRSGPLRVMEINGQHVSYDNRRLMAAQNAGLPSVPVEVVSPEARVPGKRQTWQQEFDKRRRDRRNKIAGGVVPPEGLKEQPAVRGCT
jgi:uncharacterized protein RhaS with RHS repeats